MGALLVLSFLLLVGPLSFWFGADARDPGDRGSFGSSR